MTMFLTSLKKMSKCAVCGKTFRVDPRTGVDHLCKECYEDAGIENEHADGYHADHKDEYCEACGGKTHLARRLEREAKPATTTHTVENHSTALKPCAFVRELVSERRDLSRAELIALAIANGVTPATARTQVYRQMKRYGR